MKQIVRFAVLKIDGVVLMVTVVQPISPPFDRICKGVTIFKAGCTYMVINHLAKQYLKAGIFFYLNNWWPNYRLQTYVCPSFNSLFQIVRLSVNTRGTQELNGNCGKHLY